MKLSIITVCYNSAQFIEKALQSIQAQTYEDIEKVIVDGGSSDGTQDIVRRYLGPRDKFVSETDNGIYDAMNKGVAMATGDVVYFLNADDRLADTGVVNEMMTIFRKDWDKAVVYGRVLYEDMPVETKGRQPGQIYSRRLSCHIRFAIKLSLHGGLFVELGGFDIRYRYVADQEWLLRAYKVQPSFFYVDRVVALYQYQGQSYQHRDFTRKEKQDVLRRHFPLGVFIFIGFDMFLFGD